MKAIIKKSRKQFRFVLTGLNGEIIAVSERYHNKADLLSTVTKYFPAFEVVDKS